MSVIPSLFVSHGAPTLVLENSPAHHFLRGLAQQLPRPRAIVCVSAHWLTREPTVGAAVAPETVHDFSGFPRALYDWRYPAPGDAALAERVAVLLTKADIPAHIDARRGLDHGVWTPLSLMYPDADVPVVPFSVQPAAGPDRHLAVGRALAPLRDEGVLLLASGAATHDLAGFDPRHIDAPPVDYAQAFDRWLEQVLADGNQDALLDYVRAAPAAEVNHPTPEHLLPLFVAMGAGGKDARATKLHDSFSYGILSMAVYAWGSTRPSPAP